MSFLHFGSIRISGKLTGFLAAVAGHDLIAAILTGTDDSGLGYALVLDAGHHSPHFFMNKRFPICQPIIIERFIMRKHSHRAAAVQHF